MSNLYTILRGTVGSGSHGVAISGTDDQDEMGVVIESFEDAVTLSSPFEHFIYRTAAERTGKHDARSQPGDLDLVLYSLSKYLRLALRGNPSVLTPLYLPAELLSICTIEGKELQALAPKIISKRAIRAFYHYLRAQKERLTGDRGRPELVAKYGFDTKFAMHALRLGYQGIELSETGQVTLPIAKLQRDFLIDVRLGLYSLDYILTHIALIEKRLLGCIDSTKLPEEPDTTAVEKWMRGVYWAVWSKR
jgi:uncharacterized protein